MTTLSITLEDEVAEALDAISASRGTAAPERAMEIVRSYVEAARLHIALRDPQLLDLYRELADEDVALAEEGLTHYWAVLDSADRA